MKNFILGISISIAVLFGANLFTSNDVKLGGISGDVYNFKNISSTNASTTHTTAVKMGNGVLGSITINTADARAIGIYDSISATATGQTLIGVIKASTAEQTLIYDVAVVKGIVLDVPASYAGSMTVTYK